MPSPAPNPSPNSSTQPAPKGLAGWVHSFYAGTHKDSKGRAATFTKADLEQMVANLARVPAPAVVGHPKDNAPRYATTAAAKVEGDQLYVSFCKVNPAFDKAVADGAYPDRSLSVFKDPEHGWTIRHVGFLGAVPPALEGLEPVDYAANPTDPEALFEFAMDGCDDCQAEIDLANAVADMADLFTGVREWLIAEKGLDVADRVTPSWSLDWIKKRAASARTAFYAEQQANAETSHPTNPMFSAPALKRPIGDLTMTPEEIAAKAAAEAAAAEKLKADFAAQGAELAELRALRLRDGIATKVNAWKAEGKVLPADEAGLVEFMAAIESGTSFEFSAAGTTAKTTPAEWFAEFMAKRPKLVELGRLPQDQTATLDTNNAHAIAAAAQEFMKNEADKGRTVDIVHAVAHVTQRPGTKA